MYDNSVDNDKNANNDDDRNETILKYIYQFYYSAAQPSDLVSLLNFFYIIVECTFMTS